MDNPIQLRNALFAIRGVLAFVAFTEVSTSVRCLLPFGTDERELGQGYVRAKVFNQLHLPQDSQSAQVIERTFSHVFGLYCLLNGLILFHLAVYIHKRPLTYLAVAALCAKLLFFAAHSPLGYGTITGAPNLVFPTISAAVSLVAAICVPIVTARPHYD